MSTSLQKKAPTQLMNKLKSDKGDKLNTSKFFWSAALPISFCLTGCSDKLSQPNDSKSVKIEITVPNESKGEPKSKDTIKGLSAIGSIKVGDPINRIDIIFGINTSIEKWEEFTPVIYHLLIFKEIDDKYYEIHINSNKENTIKAIACGLYTPSKQLYANGGAAGEVFFALNRSMCDGEIVKLFSPVFSTQSIFSDTNINKIWGDPLKVKKLKPNPFALSTNMEEEIRILEYQNTFLYTHLDRVIGMAIFDDDIKKLWIEKIEGGLIK